MKYKIETKEDYKKAVYKLAKNQSDFARLLHTYHPTSNFKTVLRNIQKKISGEVGLSNNDTIIINLIAHLQSKNLGHKNND